MKRKYRPEKKWYGVYRFFDSMFYRIPKVEACNICNAKKILISYPHLLGDSVLLTPFLFELRRVCPFAQIDLVGDKFCETVLNPLGIVNHFYNFGSSGGMHGVKQMIRNRREISNAIKQIRDDVYDVAIDPFCDWGASYLLKKSKAKQKIGFDFFGFDYLYSYTVAAQDSIEHIVDDMLYMLNEISSESVNLHCVYPRICLGKEQKEFAEEQVKKLGLVGKYVIGVHPGASQQSKKWTGYGDLVKRVNTQYNEVQFLIFEGPGEAETIDLLFEEFDDKVKESCKRVKLPLDKYIATLAICNVVICNDSSCGHLTAALEIPVVVIYGQGCPDYIGVRSERASVEIVDVKNVDCKPCYQDICPNGNLKCIAPITVDEVYRRVEKIIDEHRG